MKNFLKGLLKLALACALVIALLMAMSWTLWVRVYQENAANWAFNKRFPGSEHPAELSAPAQAELAARLTAALSEPDPGVRKRAAWAIGRLGPAAEAAVPTLIVMVDSDTTRAQYAAVDALEGIAALGAPGSVQATQTPDALAWRARKALLRIRTPEALTAAAKYPETCPEVLRRPNDWCAP